jgi:mannose-6-phosphate isomerase-like protein (cupin superfamily)
MTLDPQTTYVQLADDGTATQLAAAGFWDMPEAAGDGWLVTEFAFAEDWQNWEMHPNGDELVYLLAGAVDFLLEQDGALRVVTLRGSGAVVVPRGAWHTAKVKAPSRMLFVTRGAGTQQRPD